MNKVPTAKLQPPEKLQKSESEFRNSNECPNPNTRIQISNFGFPSNFGVSDFGFVVIPFVIRHSSFVIRHSSFVIRHLSLAHD